MALTEFFKNNHNILIIFVALMLIVIIAHNEEERLYNVSILDGDDQTILDNVFKKHINDTIMLTNIIYLLFIISSIIIYISKHSKSDKTRKVLYDVGIISLVVTLIFEVYETVVQAYDTISDYLKLIHNKDIKDKKLHTHVYSMLAISILHLIVCVELILYIYKEIKGTFDQLKK